MTTDPLDPFAWTPPCEDECFLCGDTPEDVLTREHVFPRWLQDRFALWDQRMNLLNRTLIPYRQLTVPACRACNTGVLSQLEDEVRRYVLAGFETLRTIDRDRFALWLCKLYFGLLWRELSLALDRRDPAAGTIVDPELLEEFRIIRGLFKGLVQPRAFVGDMRPWSVFFVRVQAIDDVRHDFDYGDGFARVIAMRMGDVGVIACLEDNGLQQRNHSEYIDSLAGHSLHPVQFMELYARTAYDQMRLERQTTVVSIVPRDGGGPTFLAPLAPEVGFSTAPVMREPDPREWAHMLALAWHRYGIPEADIPSGPGQFFTVIHDGGGELVEIPPGAAVSLPKRQVDVTPG
jgi:hypothetical protein